MIPRVDWLSWTAPLGISPIPIGPRYPNYQLDRTIRGSPDPIAAIIAASTFEEKAGKNGYRHRLMRVGGGCDIWSSPDREDVLIELSGVGCAIIADEQIMQSTVGQLAPRLSRIDLAADMECDVSPFTFAHQRTYQRVRRIKTDQSDTGEWVQLGSRTSDHHCVVYRYAPPHPRADYLRSEIRFRRQQAKATGAALAADGIPYTVEAANNFYGWTNPAWTDRATHDDQLSGWQPDRGEPDSLRWALTQVIPAFLRMEREGTIADLSEFLDQHLSLRRSDQNGRH